jgi:TolA-binding protein
MKAIPALLLLCLLALTTRAQQAAADARMNELERKLQQATRQIDQLKDTVQTLRAEIELIKEQKSNEATQQTTTNKNPAQPRVDDVASAFVERVIEPEFAPAFRPGTHSSGGHFFVNYRLTNRDNIYARYDQFNNDPVTGETFARSTSVSSGRLANCRG